jgi:diamine N-acetyltransferase
MQFVKAELSDIEAIRELTYKIWPNTYKDILSKSQIDYMLEMMYSEQSLTKQITEDDCTFIFAVLNNQRIAFASYSLLENDIWKLHKIYILPNWQGKGIGQKTITHILDTIKPLGAKSLQLNVNIYNKALDFYKKLGFLIISRKNISIGNNYLMEDYILELAINNA